mmetsp:Transcript_18238/g.47624  ORF Transcript_18238/g.47624 Transcript_18238/m.47624 type:complete len:666 (+) Transcript_18238:60-2057(+)
MAQAGEPAEADVDHDEFGPDDTVITIWYWTGWQAPALYWSELTDPPSPAPHWISTPLLPKADSMAGAPRWTRASISCPPAIEFVVRSGAIIPAGDDGVKARSPPPVGEQWDNPPDWRGGHNYVARTLVGEHTTWACKDGHLVMLLQDADTLADGSGRGRRDRFTHLDPCSAAVAMCVPSLTQHGGGVEQAARDHGLHNGTCGFVALSVAPLAAKEARPAMRWADVEGVLHACRDGERILPRVNEVMRQARHRRTVYVGSHPKEFTEEQAKYYTEAELQECEASWWLRDNRYGCATDNHPVGDPASVHLVRQLQCCPFDDELFLGGGSAEEFAKREVEKKWVEEEATLRPLGEPWFVESPHHSNAGSLCSGRGTVLDKHGAAVHADWATEHAAIWRYRSVTPLATEAHVGAPTGTMALVANVSNHYVTLLPFWLEPDEADGAPQFVLPVPPNGRPVLLVIDSGGATSVSARQGHALCRWLCDRLLGPMATEGAAARDARRAAGPDVDFERMGLSEHRLMSLLPRGAAGVAGAEGAAAAANVRRVFLNHNRLGRVPADLFTRFPNVTILCLHDNALVELPPAIGTLARLTELRLDRNKLSHLPAELGKLTSLEVLHVPHNNLATLPAALAALAALREILFLDNPFGDGLPADLDHIDLKAGLWSAAP